MRQHYRSLLLAGLAAGLVTLSSCGEDGGKAPAAPAQPDAYAILQQLPPATGEMPAIWPELVSRMGTFTMLTSEQSEPQALWNFWKETGLELKRQGLLALIVDHGFIYDELNSNGVSGELMDKAMIYADLKQKLEKAILQRAGVPETELPALNAQGGCFRAAWEAITNR